MILQELPPSMTILEKSLLTMVGVMTIGKISFRVFPICLLSTNLRNDLSNFLDEVSPYLLLRVVISIILILTMPFEGLLGRRTLAFTKTM